MVVCSFLDRARELTQELSVGSAWSSRFDDKPNIARLCDL